MQKGLNFLNATNFKTYSSPMLFFVLELNSCCLRFLILRNNQPSTKLIVQLVGLIPTALFQFPWWHDPGNADKASED